MRIKKLSRGVVKNSVKKFEFFNYEISSFNGRFSIAVDVWDQKDQCFSGNFLSVKFLRFDLC